MDYGRGGNDGVLLRQSGEHIRTPHWSASPHHSTTQPLPPAPPNHHIIMSFDGSFDNVFGAVYGESSTISPSHGKASAHTPASHPQGHQTPKPPCTTGFPCQPVTPTVKFNVNQYQLHRGDCFLPYCHDFRHFPPFSLPKSQAPTFVHSTHDILSLFFLTTDFILSYLFLLSHPFILSSQLVISDIRDNLVYSVYLETRILRSTKEELSTVELPAP